MTEASPPNSGKVINNHSKYISLYLIKIKFYRISNLKIFKFVDH